MDLSVVVKGITFRNPITPGSSDVVRDEKDVVKCIKQGVGGIVTKSFTSTPRRTRPRPYYFPYRAAFGKGLEHIWTAQGMSHPLSCAQAAAELVPKMARLCRDEGIPLVVSIADGIDVNEWARDAKMFEEAGADMLELNLVGAQPMREAGQVLGRALGQDLDLTVEIIRAIKKVAKIPIYAKLGIDWGSVESQVKLWLEAGADGLICFNPLTGMLIDVEQEVPFGKFGIGGVSLGRAYLPINLGKVVETRMLTDAPIIAGGGVHYAADAVMYLLIGCPLVEVTGAVFENGYQVLGKIVKGVEEWMERRGYSSINDFIGKAYELAARKVSRDFISMEWPFSFPEERSSPVVPMIDADKCGLCGQCQDFCLSDVFTLDMAKGIVDINHENRCWGCGACVGWCPVNAIKLIDKDSKEVVWDNRGLAKPYRPESWKNGITK